MAAAFDLMARADKRAGTPGWCEGATGMEQRGFTTKRLSIAVLDDQVRLWDLLLALAENGVPPSQCSLWGLADVLNNLTMPGGIGEPHLSDLSALLADEDKSVMLGGDCVLAARSGISFDHLLRGADTQAPAWMHRELRGKLADQAYDGGVVLLVSAGTPGQHALAARLLLGHGSHDLHTHEFTWYGQN